MKSVYSQDSLEKLDIEKSHAPVNNILIENVRDGCDHPESIKNQTPKEKFIYLTTISKKILKRDFH